MGVRTARVVEDADPYGENGIITAPNPISIARFDKTAPQEQLCAIVPIDFSLARCYDRGTQ